MLEFHDGNASYFSFRNRPAKPDAHGDVRLFAVPSGSTLFIGRYVNLAVIAALLVGVFDRPHRLAIAEVALVVQAIHLLCKIAFVWRVERINVSLLGVPNAARVTLQSEHSGYLASVNLILVLLLDGARPVGEALCMALLLISTTAMVMSRALPRSLPSRW